MIDTIKGLPGIFYGWWIVAACFTLSILFGGVFILGFTAFFEPIVDEFGWSYTQVSLAASLRGANVGLLAPLMGFLVDRWGPRRLLLGGTILLGLSMFLLSNIHSLVMFYGIFIIVAIGTSGLSPTVMVTAVSNWFRKKAGLATGIMACGFALGSLLVPMIVRFIDLYSWRTTAYILCFGVLIIGIPLSLLVRHKPEQYGYRPDGEQASAAESDSTTVEIAVTEVNLGTKEALKSRAFWHIGIAMTLLFLAISSVIVHVMPYLSSVGVARSSSSLVAMAIPLVSIAGRLSAGWFGDRYRRTRVAAVYIIMVGLGLLLFSFASINRMWLMIPFIMLFGTGWGSNLPIRAALLREYFGRSKLGTIFGFMMGLSAMGAVIGPIFTGWVFDRWESYFAAWLVCAGLAFTAAIILITTPASAANTKEGSITG